MLQQLPDIRHLQAAVELLIVKQLRVGGLGDGEAKDAAGAAVGQDQVGPFGQLGGVGGEVGLAGEEGGEGVFRGEAVRGGRGGHFGDGGCEDG